MPFPLLEELLQLDEATRRDFLKGAAAAVAGAVVAGKAKADEPAEVQAEAEPESNLCIVFLKQFSRGALKTVELTIDGEEYSPLKRGSVVRLTLSKGKHKLLFHNGFWGVNDHHIVYIEDEPVYLHIVTSGAGDPIDEISEEEFESVAQKYEAAAAKPRKQIRKTSPFS